MENTEIELTSCSPQLPCNGRREFLTRSVAGGLAIALGGAASVSPFARRARRRRR